MTTKNRVSKAIVLIVSMLFGWILEAFPATVSISNFNDMQNALDRCSNGDTLSLSSDITLSSSISFGKSVTVLGNGHMITRASASNRINFQENVNVSDLVFNANHTSSSTVSFLLVSREGKVTMDDKTIVRGSDNGPVIIVEGTMVGGVVTGNTVTGASSTQYPSVVRVTANGTIINSLVYGNTAAGNANNYAYIVRIDGGKIVNCTIAGNTLSGTDGRRTTSYAYALGSMSASSLVCNSFVCMNIHSDRRIGDVNIEFDEYFSGNNLKKSYNGNTNPGFVNASQNDYSLQKTSTYLNKGDDTYNSEAKDLAGNDRISGTSIDYGAYEYQECATIKASKSAGIIYGERIVLEVDNVSSSFNNMAISYQWQSSRDGSEWSNIGKDANSNRYVIESVSKEIPYYRLHIVRKTNTSEVLCTSNVLQLQFAAPYVKFVASGYDRVVTHYAFEAIYGSTFTFGLERVNDARITAFSLTRKLLQRSGEADVTYSASEVNDYKLSLLVDEAYEFNLSYSYQIGSGNPVSVDTSFILRPIYKCTGKKNQLIWHDDFGTFNPSNRTYTYMVPATDTSVAGSSTISQYRERNTTRNVAYYTSGSTAYLGVPDFNNAVVGHNYFSTGSGGSLRSWATNDGYYSIVPNSGHSWRGQDQFGTQNDHTTGNGTGGMLVVNCRENSKNTRIYQRDFSVECDSSLVIFSSYIANLNMWDKATWTNNLTLINANVRLDIYEVNGSTEKLLQSAYSGEMLSRLHDYDSDPNVDTYWSNLSAKFLADAGKTYRVVLVNNSNGGAGNDMMFDDITITACCPDMAISDNPSFVNEKQNVEVCGTDSSDFTIYAIMKDGTVADDYFISPYYYLYQYREKGDTIWKNFIGGSDPYLEHFSYKVDLTSFPSGAECRAILARSKTRIQQIVNHYNASYNDPTITDEENRYPPVECKEGVYGVAYGFSISYYPDLGVISADKIKEACPNEDVKFEYDPGAVWTERNWYDADYALLNAGNTITVRKSTKEIDVYHYVIAGEGGVCPDTITFEAHMNRDLAFGDVDDIYADADANCKAEISLYGKQPGYIFCATDVDHVDYYYSVNNTGAWTKLVADSKAVVSDGDEITWKAVLFLEGSTQPLDSVLKNQPVHVADKTAPSIVRCDDIEHMYGLPSANKVSGAVSFVVAPSDIQSASEDNCTASADLKVLWNAGYGTSFGEFGSDYAIDLNAYTNPFSEYAWKVEDEAGLVSAPCIVKYEIKKDTTDERGDPYAVIRDTTVCAGSFPLSWYGRTFNQDGDTAHVGYALLKVFADSSYFRTITETACGSFQFNGKEYKYSGIYKDTIQNTTGCDSIFTLNLTINEVGETTISATACDSYEWNGVTYATSGVYRQTLKSMTGCDSVVTLNLTVGYSSYDTTDVSVANSYFWPVNGVTYTTSGQYVSDLKSKDGCDSISVLNLTIYKPSYGYVDLPLCRSQLPYKYRPGFSHMGDTAAISIVSDTSIAFSRYQMGDSIVVFDVTIYEESAVTETRSICRNEFPYVFDSRNKLIVYTPQSDTTFVIENSVGCDSVITLKLNVLEPSDTTIIKRTACDSFSIWGYTFTKDTTFTEMFVNAAGCDSAVTLNLVVNHAIHVVETLEPACDAVLWHGNLYYEDNNVATFDTFSTVTGCDSIVTLNVKVNHSVRTKETLSLCESDFTDDGTKKTYTTSQGIVLVAGGWSVKDTVYATHTVNGCDSIVDIRVNYAPNKFIYDTIFAKDSVEWRNGIVYNVSGEYTDTVGHGPFVAASGCDSATFLSLHIIPTKRVDVDEVACGTYSYQYGNVRYVTNQDTTWTFAYTYDTLVAAGSAGSPLDVAVKGDSIVTLHVKINNKVVVYLDPATSCGTTTWNGILVDRTATYEYTTPSLLTGCDSTTIIRYFVYDVKRDTTQEIVCENFTWDVTGVVYTQSGFYSDTLRYINSSRCDSAIRVLDLTVLSKSENVIKASLSASDYANYRVEGFHPDVMDTLYADGSIKENPLYDRGRGNYPSIISRVKNASGCDSVLVFDITLLASSDETVVNSAICKEDLPYNVTIGTTDYKLYGDTTILLKNSAGGDSTVVVDLTINTASKPVTDYVDVCGMSYEWNGIVYTENALDTFYAKNSLGCDSIVYLDLKLHKPTYYVEEIAACDSFEWNGVTYNSSRLADQRMADYTFTNAMALKEGTATQSSLDPSLMLPYYFEQGKNNAGCDSVLILSLNITKTVYGDTIPQTACDSFLWLVNDEHPDGIYRTSGIYSARRLSSLSNCDSVAAIDLTILHSTTIDTTLLVCANQPIKLGALELKGDTTISTVNAAGCDSTIHVKVVINPVYDTTFVAATCDSVYTWRGNVYRQSGIYTDSLKTASCGCDSVVRLDLTMNQLPIVSIDTTVCGRFSWNGRDYIDDAVISDTFQTSKGCDSIVNVNLTVKKASISQPDALELAAGDACKADLELNAHVPAYQYCDDAAKADYWFSTDSISWTHVDDAAAASVANGDTIYWRVVLSDAIGKLDSVTVSQVVSVVDKTAPAFVESCESWASVYSVFDTISGNVTFSLVADSIRTRMSDNCTDVNGLEVQWNVNGTGFSVFSGDTTFTLNAYKGDSIMISWKVVDEAGNESDICDKTYEIDRDKDGGDDHFYSIVRDTLICAGELPFSWHGATFAKDGDTAHVGSTLLRVHVDKSFLLTDTVVACGSYVWRDGQTYTASNTTAVYSLNNGAACDSVYTLNLTILETSKMDTTLNICASELPITLGASTITSDTTFTLTNAAGCDSIVTVRLNIVPIKRDTVHQIACGSFLWNNVTYTTSGFYSDTLKSVAGCDSISSLDLIVSPILRDTIYDSFSCASYTWRGKTYTEAGAYSDTLASSFNCDSIVTLVLKYEPTVVNVAMNTCEGLPGSFRGHEILGDTLLILPDENGCPIHYTITLHVTPAFSGDTADVFACYSYNWNGRVLTASGVYKDTLSSSISGCDSVAILNLTISNEPVYGDTAVIAACESYEWLGQTLTKSGLYYDTIPTAAGCDSVIAIKLTIAHPDTVTVDTTIAVGQSIDFYGLKVKDAAYGIYSYDTTVVTSAGCDVLFHVFVSATGRPIVVDSVEISGGEIGHGGEDDIPDLVTVIDTASISDTTILGPVVTDSVKVTVNGGLWFCQGDVANVKFFTSGAPETYAVTFDSLTSAAGFKNTNGDLDADGIVRFDIPDNIKPGMYRANVQLFGEGMSSQIINVKFYVSIGSSIIKRKWNDVLVCNNSDSLFIEYQWYHNNQKMEGETAQYVSVLSGVEGNYSLDVVTIYGDTFHVCGKDFEMLLPEFSITAYPVPAVANKDFTIQVQGLNQEQLRKAKLVIYSVDGVVKYKDLDGINEKNVLSLPIGDYIAVVTVENGLSANCKILVKP
jgi:hypothetical protein